jgi:A/G-specific adenine glycosylase
MLQQTQVVTVRPFFERFVERFPSVEALARAHEDQVVEAWAGLGYYSRARNLHRGAQAIVEAGGFPQTREAWLEIPGVGPYTAGAIASIALGKPEPILDGNVERVLSRVLMLGRDSRFKARLWRWSGLLVRGAARNGVSPSVFNQALMELGALVCSPKSPSCTSCPVAEHCLARQKGVQEQFPPRKPPKQWITIEEQRHVWLDASARRWVIEKQAEGRWRAGLWDFLEDAPTAGMARLIGEVVTRHVVTRHRITRTTRVWALSEGACQAAISGAAGSGTRRWVYADDSEVAGSSAYSRTREAVLELVR